jgi:hypothetical protein
MEMAEHFTGIIRALGAIEQPFAADAGAVITFIAMAEMHSRLHTTVAVDIGSSHIRSVFLGPFFRHSYPQFIIIGESGFERIALAAVNPAGCYDFLHVSPHLLNRFINDL